MKARHYLLAAIGVAIGAVTAPPAAADDSRIDQAEALLKQALQLLDAEKAARAGQQGASTGSPAPAVATPAAPGAATYKPWPVLIVRPEPPPGKPAIVPADELASFMMDTPDLSPASLTKRGVMLPAGYPGLELQGFVPAKTAGRYQVVAKIEGHHTGGTSSFRFACNLLGWIDGQQVISAAEKLTSGSTMINLVGGATLEQGGLYKLRLWTACARDDASYDGKDYHVSFLWKTPGDQVARPLAGDDFVHKE